ncbi:MAG: LytR C-terminal domain-containing protein [Candidatus Moraniibacteriota bacterium]
MKETEIKKEVLTIGEELPTAIEPSAAPVVDKSTTKGTGEPNEALFGSLLIFCLALSLIAATGYFGLAGYRYFKQSQAEKAIPSIDALPKPEVPVAMEETEKEPAEKEPVEKPVSVDKLVVIDKKTLSIKVLNGGSAKGVAGTYGEKLKQIGFTKTVIGNAFGDYAGQTLYYTKGQESGSNVIKEEVVKTYPALIVKEAPAGNKDAAAATFVLILGR